ncbi:MAG: aryl-sulfate sulfotransferase [Rubripirellula sp.]
MLLQRLIAICLLFSITLPCLAESKPSPGFTLIAPLASRDTFLINMDGEVVHQWPSNYQPGNSVYLLEDGSLLRTAKQTNQRFNARGGIGGRVQRISWDGDLLWDYELSDDQYCQHHDIEPLPNGNVLCIAWEWKTIDEAIAAGRDPKKIEGDTLWPETILEIKPVGKTGGEIVWKWAMWDHLVQSHDSSKANYGVVADHPERIDINFMQRPNSDWIHMNSVAYNEELDQILMSARWFNEIWIIDHSTTTQEAASHTGGKRGKGGDLIYRWGNPYAYFAGLPMDQKLLAQHDARWIPSSYPGGGNITVFNNGGERTGRDHSSVDEIASALDDNGNYVLPATTPFGPAEFQWSHSGPPRFLSSRISGAERQPNGNTLICAGEQGHVFEVDPDGNVVWEFRNSLGGGARPGGTRPGGDRAGGDRAGGDRAENRGPRESGPESQAPGGRRAGGREGGGGRGGAGGGPAGGGRASMFRAPRYPLDYPAFQGRDL